MGSRKGPISGFIELAKFQPLRFCFSMLRIGKTTSPCTGEALADAGLENFSLEGEKLVYTGKETVCVWKSGGEYGILVLSISLIWEGIP